MGDPSLNVNVRKPDADMPLGNNGITSEVYDNAGDLAGNLRIGKATVESCVGKTRAGNGHRFKLQDFLAYPNRAGTRGKMSLKPKP